MTESQPQPQPQPQPHDGGRVGNDDVDEDEEAEVIGLRKEVGELRLRFKKVEEESKCHAAKAQELTDIITMLEELFRELSHYDDRVGGGGGGDLNRSHSFRFGSSNNNKKNDPKEEHNNTSNDDAVSDANKEDGQTTDYFQANRKAMKIDIDTLRSISKEKTSYLAREYMEAGSMEEKEIVEAAMKVEINAIKPDDNDKQEKESSSTQRVRPIVLGIKEKFQTIVQGTEEHLFAVAQALVDVVDETTPPPTTTSTKTMAALGSPPPSMNNMNKTNRAGEIGAVGAATTTTTTTGPRMNTVRIKFKKAKLEGIYLGPLEDRKPHGVGSIQFSNGDIYLGEMKKGKMSGTGTLYTKAGAQKRGKFENNKFMGDPVQRHTPAVVVPSAVVAPITSNEQLLQQILEQQKRIDEQQEINEQLHKQMEERQEITEEGTITTSRNNNTNSNNSADDEQQEAICNLENELQTNHVDADDSSSTHSSSSNNSNRTSSSDHNNNNEEEEDVVENQSNH